jgi:hypothetical protein
LFQLLDPVLWLGGLLQGQGYSDGVGSLGELAIRERAPLNIMADVLAPGALATVNHPTPSSVKKAITGIVKALDDSGIKYSADIFSSC